MDNCIAELDSIHSLFCVNPETNFTRNRKISFSDVCRFMIELQSKSLPNEVMDNFGHAMDAPTVSAFIQQRQKIMKEGFEYLFHSFVSNCQPLQDYLYHGYRLLACDGSDENEMMLLIQRHLTPIRTDRKYPVNLHPKRNRDFVYRAA